MATTVAELRAVVTADTTQLQTGLANAKTQVQGFGATMGNLGRDASAFGNQMILATAPIAVGFGAGIKVAADFEASLAEISARTGVTGAGLKKVGDFALEMGRKTVFSSQDATQGLLQLMSSGQSLEEAMATLPDVMNLAAASGEDLGFTADAVTDIMAQFGLGIEQAGSVTDVLAKAAGASSADVASLAEGFANVGPVAATMGMNVWETASALAVLAENGIKGAEAGTALKSALLHMASPEGVKLLKEHGIAMYDLEGNARPIPDVLADIKTEMEGMTDQEKIKFLTDLGGSYGVVALTALAGDLTIGGMSKKMHESATAAEIAEGKMNTFNTQLDTLKGSVDALATEAFTPFIENSLKPLVGHLDDAASGAGEWAKANPELVGQLINMGLVLVLVGPLMKVLGVGFSVVSGLVAAGGPLLTGLAMMTGSLWAMVAPLLPLVAGLTVLAGAYSLVEGAARQAAEQQQAVTAATVNGANPAGEFLVNQPGTIGPEVGGASTGQSLGQPSATVGGGTIVVETGPDLQALAAMGYTPSEALEALASGGLGMSETLQILAAYGIPGDATIQSLVDQGVLPSSVLEELARNGYPASTSLGVLLATGLIPSNQLGTLLAQGLKVTVDINSDGSVAAVPFKGPRAGGGRVGPDGWYMVGEQGPEPFIPDSEGTVLPTGSLGGSFSIGTLILQGVQNAEQLFDQLQQVAKRRNVGLTFELGG